jgi:hypothetical protein
MEENEGGKNRAAEAPRLVPIIGAPVRPLPQMQRAGKALEGAAAPVVNSSSYRERRPRSAPIEVALSLPLKARMEKKQLGGRSATAEGVDGD